MTGHPHQAEKPRDNPCPGTNAGIAVCVGRGGNVPHRTGHEAVPETFTASDLVAFAVSLLLLPVSIALFFTARDPALFTLLQHLDTTFCLLLLGHLAVRGARAADRVGFCKRHWMGALGCIPFVESLRFFRILSLFRVIAVLKKAQGLSHALRHHRGEYHTAIAVVYFLVLITVGASLILLFERNAPHANIHSAGDALWWVFVTISTVGYGDHYPVTPAGKILAVWVIFSGIGLFGVMVSVFSRCFLPKSAPPADVSSLRSSPHAELVNELALLHQKMDALHTQLDRLVNPDRDAGA